MVELMPRQSRRATGNREPLTLFAVTRAYSRRVPLAKSLLSEDDVRTYLGCVVVDALWRTSKFLTVPAGMKIRELAPDAWDRYKVRTAG